MTNYIQLKFILTGAYAGKTIKLGSRPYPFVHGELTMSGPPEELALHARFLERNWQAYPEGHPKVQEVADGQRGVQAESAAGGEIQSDLQPNREGAEAGGEADSGPGAAETEAGKTGSVPEGDGHAESVTEPAQELNQKLRRAIMGLDPTNDDHWTQDGKPAMTAVEQAYGATDITRADVEAAAHGYNRKKAERRA